mgnify:CR=1 FL=1
MKNLIADGVSSGWSYLDASTLTADKEFEADVVALLVDGKLRIMGPREEVLNRLSKN